VAVKGGAVEIQILAEGTKGLAVGHEVADRAGIAVIRAPTD